jgi:hypothetical protein
MKLRSHKPDRLLLGWILALTITTAAPSFGQTPAPSATQSLSATSALNATPTSGAAALTTPAELSPAVRAVGIHDSNGEQRDHHEVYVQRGDEIWVDVHNFKSWLDSLGHDRLPKNHEIKDLILYLDHFPLLGVSPSYWYEQKYWTPSTPDSPSQQYTVTTVGFSLVRNDSSKPGWSHLLNQPVLQRKVLVSVGFANGEEMDTAMTPEAKESGARDQQLFLTIIPHYRTAFGFLVILTALAAFLVLARRTHIIRDGAAPRRPDGLRPYSLARSDGVLVLSRHRLVFFSLDRDRRHGHAQHLSPGLDRDQRGNGTGERLCRCRQTRKCFRERADGRCEQAAPRSTGGIEGSPGADADELGGAAESARRHVVIG